MWNKVGAPAGRIDPVGPELTRTDDALIGSLTVRETLSFAARLADLQLVIQFAKPGISWAYI